MDLGILSWLIQSTVGATAGFQCVRGTGVGGSIISALDVRAQNVIRRWEWGQARKVDRPRPQATNLMVLMVSS